MIVAGVMSGTSADGMNVALVRIEGARRLHPKIELLAHAEYPYPARVRAAVLAAMNAEQARVADLARLNFVLGELYADAVLATERRFRIKAELIGCHGQTLYHQGDSRPFLGKKIATTWQTGEASIVAARVGVPVVSDFRPADMAAGGKGAPLVPFLDSMLFADPRLNRVVQNIGGIANLTAIPAGARTKDVFAFDTGPGNMVIDALAGKLFGLRFDRGGKIAASGAVLVPVLNRFLARKFFRERPPKTAGREEFGREFVPEFVKACGRARKQDILATATALTAHSIADAVSRFVLPRAKSQVASEMILSGGGAKNATLVRMLKAALARHDVELKFSDDFGLPSEAKEAVAFAVLAYQTWHRLPSNIPSATGAKREVILGKISHV